MNANDCEELIICGNYDKLEKSFNILKKLIKATSYQIFNAKEIFI